MNDAMLLVGDGQGSQGSCVHWAFETCSGKGQPPTGGLQGPTAGLQGLRGAQGALAASMAHGALMGPLGAPRALPGTWLLKFCNSAIAPAPSVPDPFPGAYGGLASPWSLVTAYP